MSLLLAYGCIALFLLLVLLEVFLPSGGLLGVAALVALIAGLAGGFSHGLTTGLTMLASVITLAPLLVWRALVYWPRSPLGRMILNVDHEEEAVYRAQEEQHRRQLIGQQGTAQMDLLPNGMVRIGDRVLDVVSRAGVIPRGTLVEVTDVIAGVPQVRPAQPVGNADSAERTPSLP